MLRASLLINAALAVLVVWLTVTLLWLKNAAMSVAVNESISYESTPTSSNRASEASEKPVSFRWSQLESTNYAAYVANLRAIGCPEQTLRDIITADVDAVYRTRRERVRQTATVADSAGELRRLANEEGMFIASLLGDKAADSLPTADSPAPTRRHRHEGRDEPVTMPMIFQSVDLAALNLNADQIAIIKNLQQDFEEQIGGPEQDPNDPSYRARWIPAQQAADEMLRAELGKALFLQYELQAENAVSISR